MTLKTKQKKYILGIVINKNLFLVYVFKHKKPTNIPERTCPIVDDIPALAIPALAIPLDGGKSFIIQKCTNSTSGGGGNGFC